ncbi:putative ribonuclease H-like domain-containing protein [Tanacetum coccineum]
MLEGKKKPLYDRFVKAVGMHAVPSPIIGTFMPPSNKPDLDDTQVTYGSKYNNYFEPNSVSNDFVSCDNSEKSSDSETTGFASCVSSVKSSSSKTNEHLASASSSVNFKTVSKTADQKPSSTIDDPSLSFKENVKTPRNICLAIITNCIWMREDGELLLSPQQVVLGKLKGQICNEDPRTMENPHKNRDLGIVDSGCSRSMTGNKEKLDDFVKIVGGTVTFGGGDGKITGKGTIRTSKLNFENVYYVEELQNFNLFSVSQICDTKNKVLFTDKECLVLSKEFQLPENSQVVLRVPRRNNLYCFNLTEIQPERDINCLLAKASSAESTKWHRRMAHVNFKNINKLEKHGLVNGLPSKLFTNEHNCVAYNKGKQHKASYKAITAVSTISAPLQLLHMDLFGPTSIRSIDHKKQFSDPWANLMEKLDEGFMLGHGASVGTQDPHILAGPKVNEASEMVESNSDYAEELARLQRQEHEAKDTAEKYGFGFSTDIEEQLRQADMVLAGSIVPAACIPAGSIVPAASIPAVFLLDLSEPFPTDIGNLFMLMTHHSSWSSLGSSEILQDFSPLILQIPDLSSSEMEDIYHHPSTGIFTSSSYDADFGGTVTNLAPIVAVDPVPTKRTRGTLKKSKFGESTFVSYVHDQQRNNHTDYLHCLFACFLSQLEPSSVAQALNDPDWVEAMQEEMQQFINQKHVYKVVKALYGLHQAPRACLQKFKQKPDGIFISQDKYVQDMLKKFDMESVRTATTPYEASKPKSKDEPDDAVNVHLYRSMIGSLMYLTASRPDIMFAVSACSRHQVTPLTSNLNAVKKIFKYLKGQPKLGLWYPRDSPFVLEAYSDSDYAGSHGDRKSTTGGCQFLGRRLISWQCKKQTIVATSSTEAEYVAAANCCGQVLRFHTYDNVDDLLTKPLMVQDSNYLVVHIRNASHPIVLGLRGGFESKGGLIPSGWISVSSGDARVPTGSFTVVTLHCDHPPALTLNPDFYSTMAALKYREEHNKVGYLEKPKGSDDYHQVLDFLRGSHFRTPYTITEDTVRRQLQLGDDGGIEDLPIADIYLGMDTLGYPTEGKLTFYKNKFSPQWRFLVHTIQHCLSTKTGSWDQFGSPLAIALICLSDGRRFNWSSYIFKGMVHNISNAKRFLMYPRFLQIILGIGTRNTKPYHVLKLSSKLFANMRLNFVGDHMPLLAAMLPPAQAAIADEGIGEAAPDVPPETIQETRPKPDHSQEHLPTPPRPTTTDHIPPVFEQGHTSDPNIASFSGAHESDPDLFTSTNVEDETLGGSFHTTPSRSTQVPPEGPTSGGVEDLATLTALSSLVSELVQKVSILESELQAHKLLFKEVVGTLVKKVKALELKLHTRSRKVVMSESNKEEEEEQDVDPLIKLAQAAAASDAHVHVSPGAEVPPSPPHPTSDVPTTAVPTDVPSVGASTGPSTVSPGSTTVPTSISVPAADTIPATSGTTPETPSSPVRDVRKGKGVAVEAHSLTPDKTFRQLEEERLGWEAAQRLQAQELADFKKQRAESLMKDTTFARQMSQDFEMTEDQRKRQQEQKSPDLSSTIFRVEFTDDAFAARMVELVNTRRKELAEQRAKERRERPMTPSQLRQYMRTYVKNQGPAVYSTGWTMAQVQKLSPEQLQEEFDKIQRAVAFTRGLKRDGSPKTRASSKKLKTGVDEVNVQAPSHSVPQAEEGATPSHNVSREEVAAPSHTQDIPDVPVEVPSQKATIEDVEVPSNIASTAQHTTSSFHESWYRKKRLGSKGVHTSRSSILIDEGDPEAENKVCIKYASDADSTSDDDTPVHFYAVVDWELLPTGLGSINAFYRLDNSRKYFTSLWEILHLVTREDLMTIYGRVMSFYQDTKAEGISLALWGDLKVLMDSPEVNDGSDVWKNQHTWNIQSWKLYSFSGVHVLETVSGLVLHMFVDKKYPLSVNLIERMLDHQLEICHGSVGNELTTAVQLIAFLKKQISDSQRPKGDVMIPPSVAKAKKEVNGYLVKALSNPFLFFDSPLPGVNTPWDVMRIVSPSTSIGFVFLLLLDVALAAAHSQVSILKLTSDDLSRNLKYVVPTGRVKVPAGRYVVPTGKDNVLVSAGRTKFIFCWKEQIIHGLEDLSRAGFYNWYQSLVALDLGLIRFGSSYDDKSWFGKGYIYRNCILPIFLAGLSLSTCKHIHLFWSHSVIPTGHLVLAGFIMFLLIVGLVTTGYIIPADRLYGSYWSAYGFFCLPCPILFVVAASIIGPQTPLDLGHY